MVVGLGGDNDALNTQQSRNGLWWVLCFAPTVLQAQSTTSGSSDATSLGRNRAVTPVSMAMK